jgi:hypothetical protein
MLVFWISFIILLLFLAFMLFDMAFGKRPDPPMPYYHENDPLWIRAKEEGWSDRYYRRMKQYEKELWRGSSSGGRMPPPPEPFKEEEPNNSNPKKP